ncbi:hypothetical protein AWC38_SpisGene19842 [Stylophora pistillata]|uniref:Uncharacterized protein n=1 Tax=Stylophora pistillata TaxID=50429 RepID=A0A2B4RHQ3_STYPI|nr:hypothetical protein AWC38_SpisGene19842 [Stylophora pistillata]
MATWGYEFYLLVLKLAHKDSENSEGNRKSSALAEDVYEALLDLVEGKAQPPVKERTRAMRVAAVRYWRAGERISVKEDHGDKAVYYEGRRILKSSEVNKVVVVEFEKTKGSEQDFAMDDTDAKNGPDSIVDDGSDTDMTADITMGLHMVDGDKLIDVQSISDVDIDLFATRRDE